MITIPFLNCHRSLILSKVRGLFVYAYLFVIICTIESSQATSQATNSKKRKRLDTSIQGSNVSSSSDSESNGPPIGYSELITQFSNYYQVSSFLKVSINAGFIFFLKQNSS